ncbi:MAG TPA: glycosyltransferase family 4 protein [Candidatus Saccharimonadales bacterium]|nr:glycosyltransferase family 4 protein [Candidatus Saccharimonadales bacterium]
MKIGLVCPYNIAKGGGVQEIVRALRLRLEQRGHEAWIITPRPRDVGNTDLTGVKLIGQATDFRSPLHTTTQLSASVEPEEVDNLLQQEKFDVLHFHEPWVPHLSRQILSRSDSVNIATFHAKVPETLMSRTVAKVVTPYTRSVLKYLHELTAVSDAAAEYIGGLTDQPVTIIPNGIDLSVYTHRAVAKPNNVGRKTIFYIGRLERRKGVKYLLRAYQMLSQDHDDISLVLAGDGPERAKLEAMASEMQLADVTFLGHVSEEVKLQLLASSDVFCSAAIFGESFGIVLLEAMASGLVTVAGDNSGYTSVMRDLGALSLVNPHDTTEFARRLELLLYQPDVRKLWKNWALKYVKQFDYERVVDQYEELYKEALKSHKAEA